MRKGERTREAILEKAIEIFNIKGFGPGGTLFEGFTSLPDCDLVVIQMVDAEDDKPDDRKLKDPATPTNELPAFFEKVEEYLQPAK